MWGPRGLVVYGLRAGLVGDLHIEQKSNCQANRSSAILLVYFFFVQGLFIYIFQVTKTIKQKIQPSDKLVYCKQEKKNKRNKNRYTQV